MDFCTACGAKFGESAAFCGGCGVARAPTPQVAEVTEIQPVHVVASSVSVPTETSAPNRIAAALTPLSKLFYNGPLFAIIYLAVMVPTYILPYFGSNSALVNSVAAAVGIGGTFQFWLHLACLWVLISSALIRGQLIGRGWLPVLPLIAAAFDMLPGLNMVPFVPTMLHIITIVLGVNRGVVADINVARLGGRVLIAVAGLVLIVLFAINQLAQLDRALSPNENVIAVQPELQEADVANTSMSVGGAPPVPMPPPGSVAPADAHGSVIDPDVAAAESFIRPEDYALTDEQIIADSTPKGTLGRYEYTVREFTKPFIQKVVLTDVGLTYNDIMGLEKKIWFGQVRSFRGDKRFMSFSQVAKGEQYFYSPSDANELKRLTDEISAAHDNFKNTHAEYLMEDIVRYNTISSRRN